MAKMNIENVVASKYLGQELDLNKIEAALDGAEYNPQQFPGLVYRLKEPKTATLIFRSGKVVCTGAKCREDVAIAIGKVAKDLEKADIKITIEPKIEVQNIVASSDLEQEITSTPSPSHWDWRRSSTNPSSSPDSSTGSTIPRSSSSCSDPERWSAPEPRSPRTSTAPSTRSPRSSGPPA